MVFVIGVFQIAVRRIGSQRFTGISFGAEHSLDFLAGVFGVELVENVDERRHVVLHLICTVYTVVDGDEVDIVVREHHLRVHTYLEIVPSQPAHILYDDGADTPFVDHAEQALPVRAVKIGSAVTIVYEISRAGESVIVGILFQDSFLRRDLSRLFSPAEYKCPTLL